MAGCPWTSNQFPARSSSAKPQHTQRQQGEHGEHGNAIGARKKVDTKSWKMLSKIVHIHIYIYSIYIDQDDQGSPDDF